MPCIIDPILFGWGPPPPKKTKQTKKQVPIKAMKTKYWVFLFDEWEVLQISYVIYWKNKKIEIKTFWRKLGLIKLGKPEYRSTLWCGQFWEMRLIIGLKLGRNCLTSERIYHSKFTVSKVNKISSSETKMKLCGVKIIIAQSDPLDLIFL